MFIAYIVLAVLMAFMATGSGALKLRQDPRVTKSIHEVVGVPMRWFPWLATCEIAGALGLLIGLVWRPLGIAAAVGLVIYFIGAIISHIRVKDFKSVGSPVLPLLLSVAALVTRILS